MSDLKIPNLNKNSEKYLFKKRLSLRRKSKRKLLNESFFMLLFSSFLIYLNYLIPDKKRVFDDFFDNVNKLNLGLYELGAYLYEILIIVFMIISTIFVLVLSYGAFSRILKISQRKSKKIPYS